MAEQHYKETKAAKAAQQAGDGDSDYHFDLALCRKTFNAYDRDGSGYLDVEEVSKLAEVMFMLGWDLE